jgi:hypothetical protein
MKVPVGERIPRFFGEGDFVVIEPAPLNLDRMVDSIVAVYFEERPPSIELGSDSSTRFFETMRAAAKFGEEERRRQEMETRLTREANPRAFAESQKQNEQLSKRVSDYMADPVLKFGWLRLQPAGSHWEGPIEKQLSRVALETSPSSFGYTGPSIPLSEWQKGIDPIRPNVAGYIKRPAHVVGRLVGWFKATAPGDAKGRPSEL